MTLNFNSKEGRSIWNSRGALGHRHDFNGVHGFRLHPVDTPCAAMNRSFHARLVRNCAVWVMIANMRRRSAHVPIQKETRPTVVMHRFCRARGRHGDFEHTDKFIFENNFVTVRCGLHGVVAVGETRSVLPVEVEMPSQQDYRTHNQNHDNSYFSSAEGSVWGIHGANYIDFLVEGEGCGLSVRMLATARVICPGSARTRIYVRLDNLRYSFFGLHISKLTLLMEKRHKVGSISREESAERIALGSMGWE